MEARTTTAWRRPAFTPARMYDKGMGEAVANRTINRKITRPCDRSEIITIPRQDTTSLDDQVAAYCKSVGWKIPAIDGYTVLHGDDHTVELKLHVVAVVEIETWEDVADRVATGNAMLDPRDQRERRTSNQEGPSHFSREYSAMHHHLRQASILMSGRHLQHGDSGQINRNMEVFTNCLDRNTKILTLEHGPIAIGDVVGQTVTVRARDGQWRPAAVKSYGPQKLFKYTFTPKNGQAGNCPTEVLATANHRWFLADGSVTDDLEVGDWLEAAPVHEKRDPMGVVHGLIYGDGTAHKRRHDHSRPGVSQGRTYASIRVCKQDAVAHEIHAVLDKAGFKYTKPVHAGEDRVYYIGKQEHFKELPFTVDPDYIAGFIYGWWLADGSKYYTATRGGMEISTTSAEAVDWLKDHAAYAGFSLCGMSRHERNEGDGSFANGKPLYCVRFKDSRKLRVASIEEAYTDEVFCVEEPVTTGFVLANGLLTGNCSTSATSFLLFYLLLNGSGVGRCYDDIMMQVDWRLMPTVVCTIDQTHGDVGSGEITALDTRSAKHMYAGKTIHIFKVPDSREGWAQGVEKVETMTFAGCYRNDVLILDFSDVRKRNSPIAGMQGRPASGPGPLMVAINNLAKLRDAGMEPWRSTMYADHYLAECVLVGGARRAARMATKYWKDKGIFGFITVKRPLEFLGKTGDEIQEIRRESAPQGFLWSSNNSVMVDLEFWDAVKKVAGELANNATYLHDKKTFHELVGQGRFTDIEVHAWKVFVAACEASYFDGTGEPGFITVERLTWNDEGTDTLLDGEFAESQKMKLSPEGKQLARVLAQAWSRMQFKVITNPCGEIVLNLLGGYCVIADVVPFHAGTNDPNAIYPQSVQAHQERWDHDAEDAFRVATRALIRTNLMDSLYAKEVARTNRIGVGMTGIHEYAFARFGYGWHDLVDEAKSIDFWLMLSRFKRAVQDEALVYSKILGVTVPHTDTTMKPAGTTSKLFGLTEGAHLPSMREFLRWVQFRNDDPLVATYEAQGYPVRKLQSYSGTTIVGFPTVPTICTLGMDDKLVTAGEATPEEQYQWLRLLEKYWIVGVQEDGVTPLRDTGNQVSYTLKYLPGEVSFEHFMETLLHGQSSIRCCSVMPQSDTTSYEYQPEEPVTKARFEQIIAALQRSDEVKEDVGQEHVDHCAGGACPISWGENSAAT